jgi:hypothetical protein
MWMVLMVVALLPLVAVVIAVLARKFRPLRVDPEEPKELIPPLVDVWPVNRVALKNVSPAVLALHKKKLEEERERAMLCFEEELKARKKRGG